MRFSGPFISYPSVCFASPPIPFACWSHNIYVLVQQFRWDLENKQRLILYAHSPAFNQKILQNDVLQAWKHLSGAKKTSSPTNDDLSMILKRLPVSMARDLPEMPRDPMTGGRVWLLRLDLLSAQLLPQVDFSLSWSSKLPSAAHPASLCSTTKSNLSL